MKKLFGYFKQTGTHLYYSMHIAFIALSILLITAVILTIHILGKDDSNKKTFAQAISNYLEPENGTVSGNVSVVNDSNTSGGKYILLGSSNSQCDGAIPPPAASSAGLTKLQFCDDFSDPSTFDFKGTGNPGFKWYRNYWFGFSQNTHPEDGEPESSFTISNGILELHTTQDHYQSNMQSAILKNSQPVGYYIDRETNGWYVESAMAHPGNANGVALWSMDMCHTYQWPARCDRYAEPDWYEYWNLGEARATHLWYDNGSTNTKIEPDCNNWKRTAYDTNTLHTYGARTTSAGVTYWRDNSQVAACDTMSWKGEVVAGPPGGGTNVGRYPIYIGTQPGYSLKLDFVRVWVKP